ncbi:MAG TPA: GTP-binding protein [Nanoarchaeota archaeon]|nr:GTP-binding protein [Nanoarchaeota archaeon]
MKTPIVIITGYLGAGKTTLLRNVIETADKKIAVLMNEFGAVGIDGAVIKGKDVDMIELSGGCVCCSMTGEFEAAIKEIREKINPELIVIETTGVAEPDAIVGDILENIEGVRLDVIITIADADSIVRFPSIGHTGRVQIEMADILILNKTDLVDGAKLEQVENKVKALNANATIFRTKKCNLDTRLLFGLEIEKTFPGRKQGQEESWHLEGFENFAYFRETKLDKEKFESFLQDLPREVYRAKGFVLFDDGTYLFNYVGGRHDFEKLTTKHDNEIVFIGQGIKQYMKKMINQLRECEVK